MTTLEERVEALEAWRLKMDPTPPPPPPPPPAPVLMPVWSGLATRGGMAPEAERGRWNAWSPIVNWADIEPQPGKYDGRKVEKAIEAGQKANMQTFLRPYCGVGAPDHVKALGGGPLVVHEGFDKKGDVPVPVFWDPAYIDAYQALHQWLSQYDGQFAMVAFVPTMTVYAEPMLRQGNLKTKANAAKLGYTAEADMAGWAAGVAGHAKSWKRTRTSIASSPFQLLGNAPKGAPTGVALSTELLKLAQEALGKRLVIQSNSLDAADDKSGAYHSLYKAMTAIGAPVGWQTERPDRIVAENPSAPAEQWRGLLDHALSLGACFVESTPGAWRNVPAADADRYNAAMKANAAKYN